MKTCTKCKKVKELDRFGKSKDKKGGLKSRCKECSNEDSANYYSEHKEICKERNKSWRDKNPEKVKEVVHKWRKKNPHKAREAVERYKQKYPDRLRDTLLRSRYGLSLKDYEQLLEKQGGCCAICNRHFSILSKNLVVDHDHKTNEVRGLLCMEHNGMLGLAKDSEDILLKAITYLRESTSNSTSES